MSLAKVWKGRFYSTHNAFTVLAHPRLPVQFINRWRYNTPQSVVESFDFTIAMAVVWFDKNVNEWKGLCHPEYYQHLAAKRLVYTFPVREEAAGGSVMRTRKFLRKGYQIMAPDYAGVMSRIAMSIDFDKWADMRRQQKFISPSGMEVSQEEWLTIIITSILREVDPLTVIDGIELDDEGKRPSPIDFGALLEAQSNGQ
jgi:hypothetical protein